MTLSKEPTTRALRQLASLYGVQSVYVDSAKQWRSASVDTLLAVLKMLGAPVGSLADLPSAWRFRRQAMMQGRISPVTVVWSHQERTIALRLPKDQANGKLLCQLTLETGEPVNWVTDHIRLPVQRVAEVEGVSYVTLQLPLPTTLDEGYHRLRLETAKSEFDTLVIVAPRRAYDPIEQRNQREWGVLTPLYALHSEQSWGCGDFSDLEALATWIADCGGRVVATLPLLAAFLDQPYEPSPYAPASRLFWNELYLDVTRAPGWEECPAAQKRLSAPGYQSALGLCRSASRIGYRQVMGIKRPILNLLAQHFFETPMHRAPDFQTYLQCRPEVEDYARFRAVGDRLDTPWTDWPSALHQGLIEPGDYDERDRRYHLYAQWAAHSQLSQLTQTLEEAHMRLGLELPLGVHPHSYDVWRERDSFVLEASVGTPPDRICPQGQNWGFPPLHPEIIRQQGYRYVLSYLRHQLQHADFLRIDHMTGLHRSYWVPQGADSSQGVYVRYATEELYAILTLESHRHQVSLVGEHVGTIPNYVSTMMARHRLRKMSVGQSELTPDTTLTPAPRGAVASLNTPDLPTVAAYCQGLDIDDRAQQGALTPEQATQARHHRQACLTVLRDGLAQHDVLGQTDPTLHQLLSAWLAFLGASPAQMVLLNLEDLWLETQSQRYPERQDERPNWQSKWRYSLEQVKQMPEIESLLERVHLYRTQGAIRPDSLP